MNFKSAVEWLPTSWRWLEISRDNGENFPPGGNGCFRGGAVWHYIPPTSHRSPRPALLGSMPKISSKRIIFTKERRKQKDFFEKKRLKSKMKVLGASPPTRSAVSLDLLNLHVVNQISNKKNRPDKVKKTVHVEINQVPGRWRNIELPKTPEHKPPKPFLNDIENRLQKEVLENRRKYISEKEKLRFQSHSVVPHNQQPANSVDEELWLSKAAQKQRNVSEPQADTPLPLYFQQLNSPNYSHFFRRSPKVPVGEDLENRGEPLFGLMHDGETLNAIQDTQPVAVFFEEESHYFPASTEFYHSFSNNNIMNQIFIDSTDVNQASGMYSLYDVKEKPPISSCAKRQPAERDLESIFTAPEKIYSQNTQSFRTLDQDPVKKQFKDYCIQERNPVTSEQQDSEHAGGFISQQKRIKTAAPIQNYFKKNKKSFLAEPNLNNLHIFGLEETGEEVCSNYNQSSKPARENDDESLLSSQSPSYSPEQTERCTSATSSESAEEDQDGNMSSCYENYIPRNDGNILEVSGNQRSCCNCPSMDMPFIFRDSVTRDTANAHPQVKPTVALPLQITSQASLKNKPENSKAWHNACCQTEKCAWEIEKSDAVVQCDIIQACSCKNKDSSVHSAEIVTSTSKTETTGGQNIPADTAASQPSSTSSTILVKGLPSETEYLGEQRKISVGILN